ncbi:MAG: AEC family transporter [Alphaproteobacteria bacterium]|nr:MAG: AEC family transporter [Alphaproteobacteria bacterium]
MSALLDVTLPVFLVIGFGFAAVRFGLFPASGADALMRFAQNFAVPCLLFRAIATLDLGAEFDPALLAAYYTGAGASFAAGALAARLWLRRPAEDAVSIGFSALFANSVLLGLPIMERAFGPDSLGPNYAIIAFHAAFCYGLGVTTMETVRSAGRGLIAGALTVARALARNPLMIAIALGFAVNLGRIPLPGWGWSAIDLVVRAALPTALFALGTVLVRYRPEGDLRAIALVCLLALVLRPGMVWLLGRALELPLPQLRAAVLTAAMAPGVNTYIFADMYGRARRVAASSVLIGTALAILTVSGWLTILG